MKKLICIFVSFFPLLIFSQNIDWRSCDLNSRVEIEDYFETDYPFINFEQNSFQFVTERSPNFEAFFKKFKAVKTEEIGKLNVYHIGGSHIQADIHSNLMREKLQSFSGQNGERGIVFPLNLAGTNNPSNYRITSPNHFTAERIVAHGARTLDLGLMGVGIRSTDSVINMVFKYRNANQQPCFNEVFFFRNKGEWAYEMNFGSDELLVESIYHDNSTGFTKVKFCDPLDSLDVQFKERVPNSVFEFYGMGLENTSESGISYTSIGINGAGLYSYLGAPNFQEQLMKYPPDMFIFSVGTNDANVPYERFEPESYKSNLEKVMKMVLKANPKCALLLTVPNDAFYKKKYANKNVAREREVIFELAEQYQMAVWDLYGIMGELGSSKTWLSNGLMQSDYVHFTSKGYQLKGRLLFDAFLKYFQKFEQEL